jgi:hypothetical protein
MTNLINPLSAIIQAASQLPTTGIAANYHQRIGTGNAELSGTISNLLPPSKL